MESILQSIKKLLGISEDQDYFNADIIMHINSVFSVLTQLGVGPKEGFIIEDDLNTWNEFISDDSTIQLVKSYVYMKVKLLFDPPASSSVINSMEKIITEYEWRINTIAESSKTNNEVK